MIKDYITKQDYLEMPTGYCYESHVEVNTDIYETAPTVLLAEQEKIITNILSFFSEDPTVDDNITCKFPWEYENYEESVNDSVEYFYKGEKVLEVDTCWQEGNGRLFFQYRVFGIGDLL